jgi:hypothetical protein
MKGFLQVTSACKADILTAADIPSFAPKWKHYLLFLQNKLP